MLLAGMSGKSLLMSVHVAPPSVDLKTWPMPAPGPSVKRRLKPLTARYRFPVPSTVAPAMNRFGTPVSGDFVQVQIVPSYLPTATPRVKPELLQGPHQAAMAVSPEYAIAVATWPAFANV